MPTCVACGHLNTIEYDVAAGTDVCTYCGTLAAGATSGLEVLGRVLEDEQDEQGRTFLHEGGTGYVGGRANIQGLNVFDKSEARSAYHDSRKIAIERYIRSVLAHFGFSSLFSRTKTVFHNAKQVGKFRWGEKARIIAVASVYVVSRERDKGLRLLDLAAITEIDLSTLTRAQNTIKLWLKIKTTELDPIVFLERHILHFSNLLRSSPTPLLSGSKKKAWSPPMLPFLRSLKLPDVRTLAEGLLSFCADLKLTVGRSPEQVSIAVIVVAMEGVARRPVPMAGEVMDELANLLSVRSFTVAERYRELNHVLEDFAPRIPWIGPSAKGRKKKEMVAWTEDIVKFRKALDAKKNVAGEGEKRKLVLLDDSVKIDEEEDVEEFDIEEQQEVPIASGSGAGLPASDEDDEDDEEDDDDDEGDPTTFFPDPLANPKAAAAAAARNSTSTAPSRLSIKILNSVSEGKRPAEYMRQRPGPLKRVRTIEQAASSLLTPFSSTPPPFNPLPSSAVSALPLPSSRLTGRDAPFPAHSQESVRFRQLLLAGHDSASIYDGSVSLAGPTGRLSRLLWERSANEITDDELFGVGELEGLLRTPREIEAVSRTERFRTMPEAKPFVERRPRKKKVRKEGGAEDEFAWERRSKVDEATKKRLARIFEGEEGEDDEMSFEEMAAAVKVAREIDEDVEPGEDSEAE